jgi:hypothetical protein
MVMPVIFLILAATVGFSGCTICPIRSVNTAFGEILFEEDFSDGDMSGWWVEGGEKVWVQDGHLHMKANPAEMSMPAGVCTVWYDRKFQGDVEISFDAHVVESAIDANNINFFFHYTHPQDGKTIPGTREERADGAYSKYHNLNGYIVTFLNDFNREAPLGADGIPQARLRMRRCPGFSLIDETFAYHCKAGTTYHCRIIKKASLIEFYVDGVKILEANDKNFLNEGYIGLRTFRTHLWWDNIIVRAL